MISIDDAIKKVAKNLNIDIELVSAVCKHPFIQTVQIMKDEENTQNILFNNLFKFKLKRRYKENKLRGYSK